MAVTRRDRPDEQRLVDSEKRSPRNQNPLCPTRHTRRVAHPALRTKNLSKQLCESRRRKNDTDGSSERLKASEKRDRVETRQSSRTAGEGVCRALDGSVL